MQIIGHWGFYWRNVRREPGGDPASCLPSFSVLPGKVSGKEMGKDPVSMVSGAWNVGNAITNRSDATLDGKR